MAAKAILVTGAGGFVGGHLLPALRAHYPDCDIKAFTGDILDADNVGSHIRHVKPFALIHLAAISSVAQARLDPDTLWRINLHGTLALAHAVMTEVPSCTLLFASTADAYGGSFKQGVPVDENFALAPLNPYAASKAAADLALGALAAEGLRVIRLRPFNHTGPGQSDAFVVPAFARQVARIAAGLQEPVVRVGDIEPRRDFLDVRDVCAAYIACLDICGNVAPGSIFNLSSGRVVRIGDILAALLAAARVNAQILPDASRQRPTDIAFACGNAQKLKAVTGWHPIIPWEQTLEDVLRDWQTRIAQA